MWQRSDLEVTHDTLLRGRVKLIQPARGYRSSLDSVLLADFIRPPYGHFLDVGCGVGALSFLLLARDDAARGTGVEIQNALATLCARAAFVNGFGERMDVLARDARDLKRWRPEGCWDLVATNPPFYAVGTGRLSPDPIKLLANHEVALTLANWLDLAAWGLRPGGRLAAIFPAERRDELAREMERRGLRPVRQRLVHTHQDRGPSRALIEGCKQEQRLPLCVEPPLTIHQHGCFSAEVRRALGEEADLA